MIARPAIQYRAHCSAHGAAAPWPRNSCPGGHSRAGFLYTGCSAAGARA